MNAKVPAAVILVLVPNLALAQSNDQTQGKGNQSGKEAGQGDSRGKNGNGSDANGAAIPGGAESDANASTAPSSKPHLKGSERGWQRSTNRMSAASD